MPTPSLAEAVLDMLETSTPLLQEMYVKGDHKATAAFRDLIIQFSKLETFALRRADASVLENHRRIMEACHITLPEQATRG